MVVRIIKATVPRERTSAARSHLVRTAAYCRVSTSSDEQDTSYEAQRTHYTNYINANPAWTLAGIFADEGITGTQARKRPEFLRMISECEAGRIDQVITKSISRFARNTLDCLNYIRRLKGLGIPIIFEKESINTMESSGEVLVTILASIAQQESASISANVRMGIEYKFQEGHGRLKYSTFLGYTRGAAPGTYVVVPSEARVVRRIYAEYLDGYGPCMIARRLEADRVAAPGGGIAWHASTVRSILTNEKYCGDLLMQKYYTVDFLTHKSVRNCGERPQYFVENDHDPIVPRQVFHAVQNEITRRKGLLRDPGSMRLGEKCALRGRLVCARCGGLLRRYTRGSSNDADWTCERRVSADKDGKRCGCRIVRESAAKAAVVRAFNELPAKRQELVAAQERLAHNELERTHRAYATRRLLELLDHRPPNASIDDAGACADPNEFYRLTSRPLPPGALDAEGRFAAYSDDLVTRHVHKIVVYDDCYELHLKAGIRVRA